MSNNKTEEIKYTPEWVMQMFEKSSKKFDADLKKSREEADRRSAEADRRSAALEKSIKELDKKFAETADFVNKTTDAIKNLHKEVGGIGESNGAVAEETIFNALAVDMSFGGVEFYESYRNMKKKIKAQNIEGEYDILLTNGNTVAIIEAKWDVKYGDASKLATTQIENFRKLFPEYNDYKIMLGIGGMSFESRAIEEAKQQGVAIIKVIGNKAEFYTDGMKIF